MTRSLGLHSLGEQIAYALIESFDAAPPRVLAAGRIDQDELAGLVDRLAATALPWCLAGQREGARIRSLPKNWPLPAGKRAVLTTPASAAALWDYEQGRFEAEDLYIWLSATHLHWSRGYPGRGRSGSVPRRGPLRDNLRPAIARARADRSPIVFYLEGDAPGGDLLQQSAEETGHVVRPLHRPAEEMGADPAAAGAALAAQQDKFPALYFPQKRRKEPRWRPAIAVLASSLVGVASAASLTQASWLETWREQLESQSPSEQAQPESSPALPAELQLILDRRAHLLGELADLSHAAEGRRLTRFTVLTGVDSAELAIDHSWESSE